MIPTVEDRLKLAAIVEGSDDAILSKDMDGTILSWNDGARRMYGYTAAEVIGRSVAVLVPPELTDDLPKIMARLRRGESVRHYETVRLTKAGQRMHVSLTISPVRDERGVVVGASTIARDIDARKRAEDALLRYTAELRQFAFLASHDLQEPLRSVSAYAELLRRRYAGRLDAEADEFLGFMVDAAQRMHALVHGLLDYSRHAQAEPRLVPTDAEEALALAKSNLAFAIESRGASIRHEPLPRVLADPDQLVLVLQNLLANAIKFCARPPEISIDTVREDGMWRFSIHDNGIGIQTEHAPQLFVLFRRLHPMDEYPGTGLGLALSKKVIEGQGGRIGFTSTPGVGSTFWFTLRAADPKVASAS